MGVRSMDMDRWWAVKVTWEVAYDVSCAVGYMYLYQVSFSDYLTCT